MKQKKKYYFAAAICLTAAAIYYLLGHYLLWSRTSPWDLHTEIASPALTASDTLGNSYLIDDGMMRIMKVDAEHRLDWLKYGTEWDREVLYRCRAVAGDSQGNLYAVNQIYDAENARQIVRESIVKFSPEGDFLGTLVRYDYPQGGEQPELDGWINSIRVIDDVLYFTYQQVNALELYRLDAQGASLVQSFPLLQARTAVTSCKISYDGRSLYYFTKTGRLLKDDGQRQQLLRRGWGNNSMAGQSFLLRDFDVDAAGNLYFIDNFTYTVQRQSAADPADTVQLLPPLSDIDPSFGGSHVYTQVQVSADGSRLTALTDQAVVRLTDGGQPQVFTRFVNGWMQQLRCLLSGLAILWLLAFILWGGWHLWAWVCLSGRAARIFLTALCMVSLVVFSSAYVLMEQRNELLAKQVEGEIYSLLKMASWEVNVDALKGLQSYADYDGTGRLVLADNLRVLKEAAAGNKDSYYFVLYKTDGVRYYQVLDHINSISPLRLIDAADTAPFAQAARDGGILMRPRIVAANGIWSAGITGLYDRDGRLVGLLEVGVNAQPLYARQMKDVWLLALGGLFFILLLLGFFYCMLRSHIREVIRITTAQQAIEAELSVARNIQSMLLPHEFPVPGPDSPYEIQASIEPARSVGGDFYDFYSLDRNHVCVTMADVSGKGVPAALFMVVSRTIMKNLVLSMYGEDDLGAVMRCANQQLQENNDEMMFVTVFLGILDVRTGRFTYVNGGHCEPVIGRKNGGIIPMPGKRNPLVGAMPGLDYHQQETVLAPGEWIFFYTDGVTEAMNEANELYGSERLLACLQQTTELSPQERLAAVRASIRGHVGAAAQSDDITMMVLKRSPSDETESMS